MTVQCKDFLLSCSWNNCWEYPFRGAVRLAAGPVVELATALCSPPSCRRARRACTKCCRKGSRRDLPKCISRFISLASPSRGRPVQQLKVNFRFAMNVDPLVYLTYHLFQTGVLLGLSAYLPRYRVC